MLKAIIVAVVAIAAILLMSFGVFQMIRQSPSSAQPHLATPVLPECNSPEVVTLLSQLIRGTPGGASFEFIDGHEELSFDEKANVRTGRCVAHRNNSKVEIEFIVEWLNRDKGQFAVRLVASDLPRCDSSEVVELLNQVIRGTPLGASIEAIDGHQELSFDEEANVRAGRCLAHTNNSKVEIEFIVEWLNRDKGQFTVRLATPDLPECDSPEVVALLSQLIRDTPLGASIEAIDGHEELSFDEEANVRTGRCLAHTKNAKVEVKFIVEWLDRDKGQFAVRLTIPLMVPDRNAGAA